MNRLEIKRKLVEKKIKEVNGFKNLDTKDLEKKIQDFKEVMKIVKKKKSQKLN